jgi:hypothetical protein
MQIANRLAGPQVIQVSYNTHALLHIETDTYLSRMLEDPSYDQVVRWGKEGDSFVVLEASARKMSIKRATL